MTTTEAEQAGFHRNALRHHTREGGHLERAGRGLYRLRFYPSSPFEHIAAAWSTSLSPVASAIGRRRAARFHYPREPLADGEVRHVQGPS